MNSQDSDLWTQHLIPELAKALESTGPWLRVEESRKGGWYCLHGQSGENATKWYHLSEKGKLKEQHPLEDSRLPALSSVINHWITNGISVELLAWRLGSRAIFRLGDNCFAKVFRKNRQVLERWQYLSKKSPDNSISIPEITHWDDKNLVLTVKEAQGKSLNELWKSGQWDSTHIDSIVDILSWLAKSEAENTLPTHSAKDEIKILQKRDEVFHRILAAPPTGVKRLVDTVIERLKSLNEIPPVVCHRDFHDKQVLISESTVTLLDLDLLAISDPALDAGNIIAHLRLRSLQGLPVPWLECASRISNMLAQSGIPGERLKTWTASTFARLLLIYSRRQRPSDLLQKIEEDLEELLMGTGKWQGVFK